MGRIFLWEDDDAPGRKFRFRPGALSAAVPLSF